MFEYTQDRFDKFDYHKDCDANFIISPKTIDKLRKTNNFVKIFDGLGAYKYYLMRRMVNVNQWYKGDLFDFYEPQEFPYKQKLLFVVNRSNGRLDNIINRNIFDIISDRISKDCTVYTLSDHSIYRAKERIPEVFDMKHGDVCRWLLKNLSKLHPCELKPQFKIMALLNHNFETCGYYMDREDRVYVVKDHLLMTIHCNESERWTRK